MIDGAKRGLEALWVAAPRLRVVASLLLSLSLSLSLSLTSVSVSVAETVAGPIPRPDGVFGRQVLVLESPIEVPDFGFEERLADGGRADRAMLDFRGRVVVLNFWATWCGVCARELPKLDSIAPGLAAAGVDVVALSIDDDIDQASRALIERGHSKLRVFHDTSRVLSTILGVRGVPTSFVVGPDGLARAVVQGPAAWESPEAIGWLRSLALEQEPRSPDATTPGETGA